MSTTTCAESASQKGLPTHKNAWKYMILRNMLNSLSACSSEMFSLPAICKNGICQCNYQFFVQSAVQKGLATHRNIRIRNHCLIDRDSLSACSAWGCLPCPSLSKYYSRWHNRICWKCVTERGSPLSAPPSETSSETWNSAAPLFRFPRLAHRTDAFNPFCAAF